MPGSSNLQVAANGQVTALATSEKYRLSEIEDPLAFFLNLRSQHTQDGLANGDPHYGFIAADTTHNCNLRCRFCPDDFSQATRDRMSEEDFRKLMGMAELAAGGGLFLSCLYEPFLHPRFTYLLSLVPPIGREKAFFTTNLSVKRFKPEDFAAVASANVGYVNVSVDSLDRLTYEKLRVNADYDVFSTNLKGLAEALREASNSPKLRFISMAFRSNYAELFDLARIAREEYGVAQYEVRLPFSLPYAPQEWAVHEILTAPEWARLEDHLSSLGQPVKVMVTDHTALLPGAGSPPSDIGLLQHPETTPVEIDERHRLLATADLFVDQQIGHRVAASPVCDGSPDPAFRAFELGAEMTDIVQKCETVRA